MIAVLLGAAWMVLFAAAARRLAPRAGRVPVLLDARPAPATALAGVVGAAVERLGGGLARLAGRPRSAARDRVIGAAALVGAGAAVVLSPWWGVLAAVAVGGAGGARLRHRRGHGADLVAEQLPDVVDLFVLAAGSGLNVALAVQAVARFATGPLGDALADVERTRARGGRLADALDGLPEVAGEPVRPLAVALAGAERYGTALVPALEALAIDVRRQRRRRAEYAARQAPVKLIFPLVLCALPAFALLTVVPLLLATLRSLRP